MNHDAMHALAVEYETLLGCNCDLDNWEPEGSTGHSWVCRVHKAVVTGSPTLEEARLIAVERKRDMELKLKRMNGV